MKFWIWGPATNWHNIESVAFFSKSLHPTEQYVTESILSCLYLVLQYVHPLCTHPVFPCICPASLLSCLMHFPCLTSLLSTVQQLFFPAYFLSLTQYFLTCPKPTVLASVRSCQKANWIRICMDNNESLLKLFYFYFYNNPLMPKPSI